MGVVVSGSNDKAPQQLPPLALYGPAALNASDLEVMDVCSKTSDQISWKLHNVVLDKTVPRRAA